MILVKIMYTIFGPLVLIFLDIGCTGAVCPHGWLPNGNSCYLFGSSSLSWYEASSACQAHHSNLASIESMQENEFLKKEAMARRDSFWLGGCDDIVEGEWIWSSSEKLFTFTNWSPNQPNNILNEDCLVLSESYNWHWNDVDCSFHEKFICERDNPVGGSSVVGK